MKPFVGVALAPRMIIGHLRPSVWQDKLSVLKKLYNAEDILVYMFWINQYLQSFALGSPAFGLQTFQLRLQWGAIGFWSGI